MFSLYPTVLGPAFSQLAPLLQRFHTEAGTVWQGEATVRRSKNLLLRLLLCLGRFPKEGQGVGVTVQLAVKGEQEVWQRRFADRFMVSRQYMTEDGLHESIGLLSLSLVNDVREDVLFQHSAQSHFLGVRLPDWLALNVVAREWSERGRLHFDITINFVRWELLSYTGWVQPIYSRWLPSNSDSEIQGA
ncbi:DUF4166 domain-containing protein [Chitinimonas sp. PSY-7]|uniref:DUF4166 domain-containing protein n=1 Tax=Chitinimonas sp. PSY-7 TaxID=3459088 RepID=UPI00403FD526